MANKYLKYFLIVGVIGVWGAVLYRLLHGLGDKDLPVATTHGFKEVYVESPADTFSLYADYPDPFIPEIDSVSSADLQKKSGPIDFKNNVTQPVDNTALTIAAIKYNGVINNTEKKVTVGIITINGKESLVKEKDKVNDITIMKIQKDNMRISYKGKSFFIKRID